MRQSKNQTNDTGLDSCVFCERDLDDIPEMSTTILVNNGHRFPAHLGCWYDHAADSYQDAMLERHQADEQIMTEREEIAYERWLDAAAEGRGL